MSRPLKSVLNEANPNKLAAAAQMVRLGDCLAGLPLRAKGTVSGDKLVLPNNAKCMAILSAFSVAGTLTGPLTPVNAPSNTKPATTLVGFNADGDILCAAADAVTSLEVVYVPHGGEPVTESLVVTSGEATFLGSKKASQIISAVVTQGVVTGGTLTQDIRGTASPASGHFALELTADKVKFNSAQVVNGTCQVTYIPMAGQGNGVPDTLYNRLNGAQSAL